MKRPRLRLTYSNVVSTIALFIALAGGTAYAAAHLGKESVGAPQLKKGAVTPVKLAAATKAGLTGARGPEGPQGRQGPQGTQGAQGIPGPASGPAGGALAGTYPDPSLAAGTVGTTSLADGSVTGEKLASGSVGSAQIAAGGLSLASTAVWTSGLGNIGGVVIANGSCQTRTFADAPTTARSGDYVVPLISPESTFLPGPGMWVTAATFNDGSRIGLDGTVCNFSGGSQTLPSPFELSFVGFR